MGLPPGTTQTLSGPDLDAPRRRNLRGDSFAELQKSGRRSVLGPALIEGLLAGFNDMFWSRKIRCADFEVDDAFALFFQSLRLCQHFKSGFGSDPIHFFDEFHRSLNRDGIFTTPSFQSRREMF